jgi:hypothetical protein
MLLNEFKINEIDKCIYVKHKDKDFVIVCLCRQYVYFGQQWVHN